MESIQHILICFRRNFAEECISSGFSYSPFSDFSFKRKRANRKKKKFDEKPEIKKCPTKDRGGGGSC